MQGLYDFWDELRHRHPGLWIDNCASGGMRIDLESLTRSLPLWPSDFPDLIAMTYGQGMHVGDQCINGGLAQWIPLFGGTVCNFTPYSTRSEAAGGFVFGFHHDHDNLPDVEMPAVDFPHATIPRLMDREIYSKGKTLLDDAFPVADAKGAIREWKSLRPFFLGDFHLLLPLTVSHHDWCAWQFHRNEMDAGFAVYFRRHLSPFSSMEMRLKCINAEAQYDVSLSFGYEEAPRERMTGTQLLGLPFTITDRPGSLLVRYTLIS